MTTTTMHFGPEWMRTKQQPPPRTVTQPQPSPPPAIGNPAPPGASTYSALVSPAPVLPPQKRDEAHPFRYSREELLRIYKEGGGKGGLGLEVERWEGIVREVGTEPISLREITEAEKKLFAGSINSELRRRQSTDYLLPNASSASGERQRLSHGSSATSPLRERFGSFAKRKDGIDQPSVTIPRRSSLSAGPVSAASPRDGGQPSPRIRGPFTPGFDGVLNGGDSWAGRRRLAEGLQKPSGKGDAGGGDGQQPGRDFEIKEEEEEAETETDVDQGQVVLDGSERDNPPASPAPEPSHSPPTTNTPSQPSGVQVPGEGIRSSSLSVETTFNATGTPGTTGPPGLSLSQDLADVEWSYLDLQGKLQGPFRADLMQKWHDEGYFTADLLMKRTHVDVDWISVGELCRRGGADKVFLSWTTVAAPPGLSRQTDTPLRSLAPHVEHHALGGPYQLAPSRSSRASTLDSFLGSTSNPSESPSSSFGGGRFGNGSPDPAAFGGRAASNSYSALEPAAGTRPSAGFSGTTDSTTGFVGMRSHASNDPLVDSSIGVRPASFGNMAPGRTASVDSFRFSNSYGAPQHPHWPAPTGNFTNASYDGVVASRMGTELDQHSTFGPSSNSSLPPSQQPPQVGFGGSSRNMHDAPFRDNGTGPFTDFPVGESGNLRDAGVLSRSTMDVDLAASSSFNGSYFDGYSITQQQPFPPSQSLPALYNRLGQQGAHTITIPSNPSLGNSSSHHSATGSLPPHSPWTSHDPGVARRPGPFDPIHPTSANTVVNSPITGPQPPRNRVNQAPRPIPLSDDPSPWLVASQGIVDDTWNEIPGPNSLTFQNLRQHSQMTQELIPPDDSVAGIQETSNQQDLPPSNVPPAPAPAKSRRKSSAQTSQAHKPTSNTTTIVKNPSPPPTAPPKSAWQSETEKRGQSSSASVNLREIQEAEAKKAEARKAVEKDRERLVRSVAAPTNDSPSFVASWGLPTSQVGAARNNAPQKEAQPSTISSPPASAPPVWTNANKVQPAKKSMKEIQEEEEQRKKTAVKETAAAAARRAHVETPTKPPISVATNGAGAWTTVGPSGKISAAAATSTRSPSTLVPSSSGSTSVGRTNGIVPPRPPAVKAASPNTPKIDDFPAPPSHDFLKWLSDSLKGLNSSVNVEEIMSMLLSFPLDPDPSTIEIISDLIYANSITLDGRRFAAEFVGKRKADVASRPKGAVGVTGAAARPISIADVVKAQPKTSPPEWGGFKVVNKKKKGGRA